LGFANPTVDEFGEALPDAVLESLDVPEKVKSVDQNLPEKKFAPRLELSDGTFLEHLQVYYRSLFPFKLFQRWLSYDGGEIRTSPLLRHPPNDLTLGIAAGLPVQKNYFAYRELSFTLASDAYLRFQSFKDEDELKQEIWRLCPVKIDIGAVYNSKVGLFERGCEGLVRWDVVLTDSVMLCVVDSQPKDRKSVKPSAFQPQERELVFDIDMTDYDEIRTCCSGANICLKCWDFMTISIKILDSVLREDFGFKQLLWVYSGRRGVHCWVCDESARKLGADARRAIVAFVEVVKGGEQQNRKVNLPTHMHVALMRSFRLVDSFFSKSILEKQAILSDKERWTKVLQLIPDEAVRNTLDTRWSKDGGWSSRERWEDLETEINESAGKKKKGGLQTFVRDIKFQYTCELSRGVSEVPAPGRPRHDWAKSPFEGSVLHTPGETGPSVWRFIWGDFVADGTSHHSRFGPNLTKKTGNVCVPMDPTDCDNFNPLMVPKVSDLVREINEFNAKYPDRVGDADYTKTSLKPHIEYFEGFLNGLSEEQRERFRAQRTREDRMMNAQFLESFRAWAQELSTTARAGGSLTFSQKTANDIKEFHVQLQRIIADYH
ncbi:primase, DNA, polypeptide 1 (49kDa), partial [Gonapodya sp. JEL0774]